MSEEISYDDWDFIVQKAEANIEILDGNLKRAKVGKILEKNALEFALKERAKYPKPKEESRSDDSLAHQKTTENQAAPK